MYEREIATGEFQYAATEPDYNRALDLAVRKGVDMADFDYDVNRRGSKAVLASLRKGEYVGRWIDGDGKEV